jgi:hypothetical protein
MVVGNIIVKMKFGSHLYGTDGPDSDLDFKGVFLPTVERLLLGERVKSINRSTGSGVVKNTKDDVDEEFYSLHYFLKLALEGQTVALDMLHAPQSAIIKSSHLWDKLVEQRSRFYTKNLKAFVGYARRQAAKYGVKGSRLAAAKKVLSLLIPGCSLKMSNIWDKLPESEHLHHVSPSPNGIRQYQVCGKIIQETQTQAYVADILTRFVEQYGKRARLAEINEGVDWKAMSHALRAAHQVKELLTCGTMTLPRPEAKLLKGVKEGKCDFKHVQFELEYIMEEVEKLAERSELPAKPDHKFAERFILEAYGYNQYLDRGLFTDLSYDGG